MAEGKAAVRRFIRQSLDGILSVVGDAPRPASTCPPRTAPLDIAIPVFNNSALLGRCLDSLLPTLSEGDEVWLIDDASDESTVAELMADFSRKWLATHQVRNPENLGFVGTSNRAFELTRRDIVLLNSDTEVAAGWLEHLQACLQRNLNAGIVCPLSDRATILSVLPRGDRSTREEIALKAAESTVGDVQLPTAVGFCMLLRRELIEEVGVFSQAFAPGYGEENDLSMRAVKAGWDIFAADRACVFHHVGGSFNSEQRNALQRSHQVRLDRIWPEYRPLVQSWWRDNPLRVKTEYLARQGSEIEGVVHVLHRQYHVGGTERVARTLIRALGARYRHTLLYPGETDSAWCDLELCTTELCRELMLNNRWIKPGTRIAGHGADLSCPQSERALTRIVRGSGAHIVHFHHMLHWDSLLLPALARALGCRVVISIHDFWLNCPIHNQLEHSSGQPCRRSHAQTDTRCSNCLYAYSSKGLAQGKQGQSAATYASLRHALIREILENADAILVPSHFILDKILTAYPTVSGDRIHIEPHGVTLPRPSVLSAQRPGRVLAYFGGDQVLKGARIVLHMARSMLGSAVIFRVYGRIKGFDAACLPPNVELCGFYDPDDVSQSMKGVDLALLPSYYEESFSMVASECWAHGVPVLSSARGALVERVIPDVNGWLVPDMDPESWVRSLRDILNGDAIEKCREQLSRHSVTSIEQSAETVYSLYQSLLEMPALPLTQTRPRDSQSRFRKRLQTLRPGTATKRRKTVGTRCLGVVRDHWGTANYRIRFPLEDLARASACDSSYFHVVSDTGFQVAQALQKTAASHVVVQPFLSDEGLRLMEFLHREAGIYITLVVDDLWTALPQDNPVRALMPDDVPGRLSYAASLSQSLVLTTRELRRQLGLSHDNTHVINNALPEWIWDSLSTVSVEQPERLRIGWSGAPQHAGDLAFLKHVMKNTSDLADWVFLGMCSPALQALASEVHGMVPFDQYPAALSTLNLNLAIAPLADHAFNRCKSNLKVLEYGILGLPVIASDLEPYRGSPVSLVSPDDPSAWTSKIRHLLENQEERLEQGRVLRRWVLDNHMTKHRRPAWETALGINDIAD